MTGNGITLDYIGWADTFSFDHDVQQIINDVFVTNKKAEIAKLLSPYTGTIQALAVAKSIEGSHWDGKVPSTVSLWWLPEGVSAWINHLLNGTPSVTPAATPAK